MLWIRKFTISKKTVTATVTVFWQGQKDLNPRHAVLEWLLNVKEQTKTRLFKDFVTYFKSYAFDALLMIWSFKSNEKSKYKPQ